MPTPKTGTDTDAAEFKVYLTRCEDVILNEISHKEVTQRSVAQTYRLTLEAVHHNGEIVSWPRINAAISAWWGVKGLERIKSMAWSGKCFEARKAKGADCE